MRARPAARMSRLGYYWGYSSFYGRFIVPRKRHRTFDFDHWAALARDDPDRFEELRRDCVDALIERSGPRQRQRLRGIQFRIDMERRRSTSPMGACVRIQSLMWDKVLGPDGFYDRLLSFGGHRSANGADTNKTTALMRCATIIRFPLPGKQPPE